MNFGINSQYYQLYRKDPAQARKTVWKIYSDSGKSIRATAKEMGCSRNTVRGVLRRASLETPLWNNRPTRGLTK